MGAKDPLRNTPRGPPAPVNRDRLASSAVGANTPTSQTKTCAVGALRSPKGGSWRTRAQSKTHRKLLRVRPGGLRGRWAQRAPPRACPTVFSSRFVGRRPILTDLEVCPLTASAYPRPTAAWLRSAAPAPAPEIGRA